MTFLALQQCPQNVFRTPLAGLFCDRSKLRQGFAVMAGDISQSLRERTPWGTQALRGPVEHHASAFTCLDPQLIGQRRSFQSSGPDDDMGVNPAN